jgi:hypothetical protein
MERQAGSLPFRFGGRGGANQCAALPPIKELVARRRPFSGEGHSFAQGGNDRSTGLRRTGTFAIVWRREGTVYSASSGTAETLPGASAQHPVIAAGKNGPAIACGKGAELMVTTAGQPSTSIGKGRAPSLASNAAPLRSPAMPPESIASPGRDWTEACSSNACREVQRQPAGFRSDIHSVPGSFPCSKGQVLYHCKSRVSRAILKHSRP